MDGVRLNHLHPARSGGVADTEALVTRVAVPNDQKKELK